MKTFLAATIWYVMGALAYASSSEEVIQEYITALRSKDAAKISELTAPTDLTKFRGFFSYFDQRDDSKFGEQLRKTYFGPEATKRSVKAISDAQFYTAYLTATRQIMLAFGSSDLEMADYKILGHVSQDGIEHYVILFHASVPLPGTDKPFEFSQPVIVSLTKDKSGGVFLQIPDPVFMNAVAVSERINEG